MNPIQSDLLGDVAHGFYTREGGVSEGIFASLNCGMGSADDADAVAENRDRLRRDMRADALVSVHQYHSDVVVEVDHDWGRDRPKADAMVCRMPGIALGILTADCAPVLLADPGEADLTWLPDFDILARAMAPLETTTTTQGRFLARLGIGARAAALARAAPNQADAVADALERLAGPGMGDSFRVLAAWPGHVPPPPGFEET